MQVFFLYKGAGVESQNKPEAVNNRVCALVSVPLWYGAGKRGTEHGPRALKDFELDEKLRLRGIRNTGWCEVVPDRIKSPKLAKTTHYESELVFTLKNVFRMVSGLLFQKYIPLVFGGDHSLSIATIAAQARHLGGVPKIGVIWFDAHGDAHTPETSPTGNIHGMPLAVLLGHGSENLKGIGGEFNLKVYPHNVVHLGGNSVEEVVFFSKNRVPFFSKKDLDTDEGFAAAKDAIIKLGQRVDVVIVSIDLDGFDKKDAPGVHFQNEDGVPREKAFQLLDCAKANCKIGGVDIVELVRSKDIGGKTVTLVYEVLLALLVP